MKYLIKLLVTIVAICWASTAFAQGVGKVYVRHGSGAPSACPLGTVYIDDATGFSYTNKAGSCFNPSGSGDTVGPAASTNLGIARFDGTTGKLLKNSLTTLSDAGVFTFISNKRQTFVPGAQQSGFNVGSVSTDPSIPINGDLWYNTGSFQLKAQINGSTVVLGAGVGGSGTLNTVAKFTPDGTHVGDAHLTDTDTDLIAGIVGGIYMELNQTSQYAEFSTAGAAGVFASASTNETILGDIDSVGNGTLFTVSDNTHTATMSGTLRISEVLPLAAGTGTVGSSSVPLSALTIGNAANTASQISSLATAPRAVNMPDAAGTVQLVGATNTGAILTCLSNNTVLSTATGQVFTSPGNDGTPLTVTSEGAVGWAVTRAGTVRNLYVRTGTTAKVNTPATSIVVRKNGVDTTLTVAAMTQTTTTNSSDTTHSFTVAAGDVITVSLTTTGVAGVSTSIASITFEID